MSVRRLHLSFLPLVLLATGSGTRCEFSTASSTGELRLVGTIHFLESDGGCWQLVVESGGQYEIQPEQAPASLLRDRVRVSVIGEPAAESDTGCRVGMPIKVRRVLSVQIGT